MQERVEKLRLKMDKAHEQEIRNVKAVCMKEHVDVVMRYSRDIAAYITDEHRMLLSRFTSFKMRTNDYLNDMESWHTRMAAAEAVVAQWSPVLEAQYALDDRSEHPALRLYGCLVPKV